MNLSRNEMEDDSYNLDSCESVELCSYIASPSCSLIKTRRKTPFQLIGTADWDSLGFIKILFSNVWQCKVASCASPPNQRTYVVLFMEVSISRQIHIKSSKG